MGALRVSRCRLGLAGRVCIVGSGGLVGLDLTPASSSPPSRNCRFQGPRGPQQAPTSGCRWKLVSWASLTAEETSAGHPLRPLQAEGESFGFTGCGQTDRQLCGL